MIALMTPLPSSLRPARVVLKAVTASENPYLIMLYVGHDSSTRGHTCGLPKVSNLLFLEQPKRWQQGSLQAERYDYSASRFTISDWNTNAIAEGSLILELFLDEKTNIDCYVRASHSNLISMT